MDRINGGCENKNIGIIRSVLIGINFSRFKTFRDNKQYTTFDFYSSKHSSSLDFDIIYNPELEYCFIGGIQFQLSDLKDVPDEVLILSYGRNILEELKP